MILNVIMNVIRSMYLQILQFLFTFQVTKTFRQKATLIRFQHSSCSLCIKHYQAEKFTFKLFTISFKFSSWRR